MVQLQVGFLRSSSRRKHIADFRQSLWLSLPCGDKSTTNVKHWHRGRSCGKGRHEAVITFFSIIYLHFCMIV